MNYDKIIVLVNAAAKSSHLDNVELKMACEHVNKFKPCQIIYTEGIADFISIGINFALDLFLFRLRNLELRELDNS